MSPLAAAIVVWTMMLFRIQEFAAQNIAPYERECVHSNGPLATDRLNGQTSSLMFWYFSVDVRLLGMCLHFSRSLSFYVCSFIYLSFVSAQNI